MRHGIIKNFNKHTPRPSKLKLLAGCSVAAAATLILATPHIAHAQVIDPMRAFQATPEFPAGTVTISQSDTLDVVAVNNTQTIINWSTLDNTTPDTNSNPIDILASDSTLVFTGPAGYVVLNRILPTAAPSDGSFRAIALNGMIESRIGNTGGPIGGDVWLYSPGGIIVGGTGRFDIGSLILTTNDIDTAGGLFGANGEIRFRGTADSSSAVTIDPLIGDGPQISASANGSYVALIAPRVVQSGTVDVNGSIAYVGAEQVDLTINNGLFDISIGVGTTDSNGVVHSATATTTGAAATPIADDPATMMDDETNRDAQAIYMVAVPKNDAITMLVGGELGYQAAASADVVNGEVILSAGYGTSVGGTFSNAQVEFDEEPVNSLTANIALGDGTPLSNVIISADLIAQASGGIDAVVSGTTTTEVGNGAPNQDYNLSLTAGSQIDIGAETGGVLRVAGDLSLRAGASTGTGGDINIIARNNTLAVDGIGAFEVEGNFVADASASGADDFFTVQNNGGNGVGQDATAGNITIDISDGGELSISGDAQFLANAQGGKGDIQNGFGQAGEITVQVSDTNSAININGLTAFDTSVFSTDTGKIGGSGPGQIGSDSVGGDIIFTLTGGVTNFGETAIRTFASGTSGSDENTAQSNDGSAGDVTIAVTDGRHAFDGLDLVSFSSGGSSFNAAGEAVEGSARRAITDISVSGPTSSLTSRNDVFISVQVSGNPVGDIDIPSVSIRAQNGGSFLVADDSGRQDLFIDTSAFADSDVTSITSGAVSLLADNGSIFFGDLDVITIGESDSTLPSSAIGMPNARGGNISLIAQNDGSISGEFGSLDASALADSANAGTAIGGNILLNANNGSITFSRSFFASADGDGGVPDSDAQALGSGTGGTIRLLLEGATGVIDMDDMFLNTDGRIAPGEEVANDQFEGDGGLGIGGTITFDLLDGSFTADTIRAGSDGFGGSGGVVVTPPAMGAGASGGITPLALIIAGSSAGAGGDGIGGDIVFNLDGTSATIDDLSVTADGIGGSGASGDIDSDTSGGSGGSGIGGTSTFNAISGSLTVTDTLTVSANGNRSGFGGEGGFASGTNGGSGGIASGGTATFNLDGTSVISAQTVLVTTDGFGGDGGSSSSTFSNSPIPGGAGGLGGNGTGGNAVFNNTTGTIIFETLTAASRGEGGEGGDNFGPSVGEADNDGGNGGTGTGGNATINLNQEDFTNPAYIVNASATGGEGGRGLDSGDGGDAVGGVAALNVNNIEVQLAPPTIRSNATGGDGGAVVGIGGNGGNGGNAIGGTARLEVTGTDGIIFVDDPDVTINTDAFGGNGTGGGSNFVGGNAGDGGNGGDATGGQSQFVARTGGQIDINPISPSPGPSLFQFSSSGTGGDGGNGGDIGMLSGASAGDGGDGGVGTGGSPTLLAQGGTITSVDIDILGNGTGGDGGAGGTDFSVTIGSDGIGGNGFGGNPIVEVQEGSPGIISLGATFIQANGIGGTGTTIGVGSGGRIDVIDTSVDPAGLISFGSLTAEALTLSGGSNAGFYLTGNSGPVTVFGDLIITTADNIEFTFDGTAQLVVGGIADIESRFGSILINHTNNTLFTNSFDITGTLTASAGVDFNNMAGSIILAGPSIDIRAENDASTNDLTAAELIFVSAGQDASLNNGETSGPLSGLLNATGIFVDAGQSFDGNGVEQFDPSANALISGAVNSFTDIRVRAGANAIFASATDIVANNQLLVQSGDDIIINTGASLTSGLSPDAAPDPGDPFNDESNLRLAAGALGPILTGVIGTPISSIIAAGDLDANDSAVVLTANAVDGLGGSISAGSISVDINDAPANGVAQSDDNGLLSAFCVEGNVCLGTVIADNIVQIGQNSNNDVIQAVIESGTVVANDILVTTRRDIIMGTDGIATVLNATNEFLAESTQGDVNLRDSAISSDIIQISAVNGSLLGTGSLISDNDIGITVGNDINAAVIDTGGELTTVADIGGALEGFYSVSGSMSVDSLTVGVGDVNYDAGGDFFFGLIDVPGTDILLLASQLISLDTTSGAQNIDLDGGDILLGDISAALDVFAFSAASIDFGSVNAGDNIDLDASDDISGLDLDAGAFMALSGGANIDVNTASAGDDVDLFSGGSIIIGDLNAGGVVSALGGDILIGSSGSLEFTNTSASDGDIDITTAGDLTMDETDATGSISLTASGGSIALGQTLAGGSSIGDPSGSGDLFIDAAGDILLGGDAFGPDSLSIFAGGLIDIQGNAIGADIVTNSADLDIGGVLGQTNFTNIIEIQTNGTTQAVLGGTGSIGVFSLDNTEFASVNSGGDLLISIAPTGFSGFDLTIQDLVVQVADNVSGAQSANIGIANTFDITSGQSIATVGVLDVVNSNADTTLSIGSAQDLFINAESGIIQMTDNSGAIDTLGSLSLDAVNIFAMTEQALDAVFGLGVTEIDQRLGNNDGVDISDGLIRGGNVQLSISDSLFIQNTAPGTDFPDRRGFTASSLTISGAGSTRIVINGIVDGTTGIDSIAVTDINGSFDSASTINGCFIINPAFCGTGLTPVDGPDDLIEDNPIQDIIEEEVTPDEQAGDPGPFDTNLIVLKENEEKIQDPLIDEPVTGAGNDDLWVGSSDCVVGDEETCGENELEPAE